MFMRLTVQMYSHSDTDGWIRTVPVLARTKTFLIAAALAIVKGTFDVVTIIPSSDGWDACVHRLGEARFDIVKPGGVLRATLNGTRFCAVSCTATLVSSCVWHRFSRVIIFSICSLVSVPLVCCVVSNTCSLAGYDGQWSHQLSCTLLVGVVQAIVACHH